MFPTALRFSQLVAVGWVLALASVSFAQTPESSSSPILEPAKSTPAPPSRREHLVSSEIAATVASGLPKYLPPQSAASKSGGQSPDLRDLDKPKNGIVRLPKYIVDQPKVPKPPVFKERDLLTSQGLIELAMKRNPGLRVGNLFGWNEGIALLMYAEQERLDNLADMADSVQIARDFGDSAGADALAFERTRIAYRPSDIGGGAHASGQ